MTILEIIKIICYIVFGAVTTGIPMLIKLFKGFKKLKEANTEVDRAKAYEDMKTQMKIFIQAAEVAYENVHNMLKEKGSSAGPMKKDSVLLKLQNYAIEKGYEYDSELWSKEIDEEVKYSKTINAK